MLAKMTPNIGNMEVPAIAAVKGGADGIAAINTIKCISGFDLENMQPYNAVSEKTSVSGYSGKAVKPIALRFICDMSKCNKLNNVPLSGIGGIETWYDAAEFIALGYLHTEIDKLGVNDLVYTTGEVVCHPCVHTCVPDYFDFSFDSRHEKPEVLEKVLDIVKSCADKEWAGCKCEVEKAWNRDTVYWDKKLVGYVKEACEEAGIRHQYIHSGAGHDAQFASYMLPTTMIFVQSKDGLSHCEPEFSSVEHCTEGATVMLNAVLKADSE